MKQQNIEEVIKEIQQEIDEWNQKILSGICGDHARPFVDGMVQAQKILKRIQNIEKESVLDKLSDERIFDIEKVAHGFKFTEGCDNYFTVILTSDEIKLLARELLGLLSE